MSHGRIGKKRGALRPDTLSSSILILLTVAVVQRSIGFGRGVLFCRWLGAEALGHWEMAYGFLLLAAPVAVLGLPGSFGRYLTRFRDAGQLRVFLGRTTCWTLLLGSVAVAALIAWRGAFAHLVFGDPARSGMMVALALCLGAVIAHHFLEAVFAGMRLFRIVSTMHFCQSMLFAAIALTLIACWRPDALAVIVAYGAACAVSVAGVLLWSSVRIGSPPDAGPTPPHREFWPPLMRFAIWVWVTALLSNLFSVIDRYMIVHCGRFTAEEALVQVGNYHASTLVPVLLVSVANVLVGAMTPHLSHDWESGRRGDVSRQLNLALKVMPLVMLAAGVAVLAINPLLFGMIFDGQYAEGRAVAPWTLATCLWFALLLVAQTYVWCAEKSRLAAGPLAVGLVVNVALNVMLLPIYGLLGAVVATGIATLVTLAGQLWINHRLGMRLSPGLLLLAISPLGLTAGIGPAVATLAVCVIGLLSTELLLTRAELRTLLEAVRSRLPRSPSGAAPLTPSASA